MLWSLLCKSGDYFDDLGDVMTAIGKLLCQISQVNLELLQFERLF